MHIHNAVDSSEFFQRSILHFQSWNSKCFSTIYLSEPIQPADLCAKDPRFDAAKEKELEGLCNHGTFQVVNVVQRPATDVTSVLRAK